MTIEDGSITLKYINILHQILKYQIICVSLHRNMYIDEHKNMEDNIQESLSIKELWQKLWGKRKRIIINCAIAFVLACIWIFPQPRTYEASVILAPETTSASNASSGLSGLAASFGINLGKARVVDAIYPTIYPNVMESKDFIVGLLDVSVTTSNTEEPLTTTYYDYLTKHQKISPWSLPMKWIGQGIGYVIGLFKDEKEEDNEAQDATKTVDPFRLTQKQERLISSIHRRITCSIEDKTCIITLTVRDQDPLICATMADSVQMRLQRFITNYKTGKARIDMQYYSNLCEQAKKEYEDAMEAYSHFQDTHNKATLQSTLSMGEQLRNNLQVKQTTYTTFMTQYEAAKAKVQEETPSFTTLQSPSVPTGASAPRRSRFVIIMTFLTGMATAVFLLRNELKLVIVNAFRRKETDDDDDDF